MDNLHFYAMSHTGGIIPTWVRNPRELIPDDPVKYGGKIGDMLVQDAISLMYYATIGIHKGAWDLGTSAVNRGFKNPVEGILALALSLYTVNDPDIKAAAQAFIKEQKDILRLTPFQDTMADWEYNDVWKKLPQAFWAEYQAYMLAWYKLLESIANSKNKVLPQLLIAAAAAIIRDKDRKSFMS